MPSKPASPPETRPIRETVQEEEGVGDSGDESTRIYDREQDTDDNGDADAAVDLYRAAVADGEEVFGKGSVAFAWNGYDLACVCSRTGSLEDAMRTLRKVAAMDPDVAVWFRDDHDLDPLRGRPEFQELYSTLNR